MRRLAVGFVASLALALIAASPAAADFGLKEAAVSFQNADGSPATLAGSHPFAMETLLGFNTKEDPDLGFEIPDGSPKGLKIFLPPGFAGNPTAMPFCPTADFTAENCPVTAEVGVADIVAGELGEVTHVGVYNLAPPPGVAAKLGFKALSVPVTVELSVNPDAPYNVIASLENIPEVIPFYASTVRIWGTPAEEAHDSERIRCGASCALSMDEKPFLLLPRSCPATLDSLFEVSSWEEPAKSLRKPASTAGTSACGTLGFGPRITTTPTDTSAGTATGIDIGVDVTDEGILNPKGQARSDIAKAVVTLPEGVTANPALAEGLATCSEDQLKAESAFSIPGQGCPQASKIGTLEAQTPILEGRTLKGSLYVAEPFKNRFGTLIALYATLREPELGVLIRLEGKVEPDPRTGQLVGTFEDLPQFPVSHFNMHFRAGARSPLVMPALCGEYVTKAVLTPWSNPSAPSTTTASFMIDSGQAGGPCPAPGAPSFDPGFEAGSIDNAASHFSPFYMRLTRKDGEQDLTRFDAVLPPGVAGKIAGIPQCPEAAIAAAKAKSGLAERAASSCPAASQVGRVLVGAGVGPELTYVPGRVYLSGPFGGNPLSIVVITPAVAGPFDVGTVVTRESLTVDPTTAEVRVDGAASDPIPNILAGIPLKVRDIRVYIDRDKFIFNSTSCAEKSTRSTIFGDAPDLFSPADDIAVPKNARYQAADCASLGFGPKLSLQLKGGTRRDAHPALRSIVSYPYPSGPGYANIGRAVVILPPTEFIDQDHINNPCTRPQFAANACPKSSILGKARAFTPVLDHPLEGPVYFRSNGGARPLPDIVADLRGQFNVVLVGAIDTATPKTNARLRTTFAQVPDVPVTKFSLNLKGGKEGVLVNSADLCARKRHATLKLTGQNGKITETNPLIKTNCKKR